ncbi:MAG: phage replisome organizer N-terminal domain-containing protein [Erysipelotrichaceae bacterium]
MKDIFWIKLDSGFYQNRKIRKIVQTENGYVKIAVWINLLCIAGNTNDNGLLFFSSKEPYTTELLAEEMRLSEDFIRDTIALFEKREMIVIEENVWAIKNWEKYQNIGKMADVREYNKLKKREQRARQKESLALRNLSKTSPKSQATE